MENKNNKMSKGEICLYTIFVILLIALGFGFAITMNINRQIEQKLEFESIKEGLCIYVEYPNAYDGEIPVPDYILVYDYEIEKVIEIDMYDELVHTRIYIGDTILYCVDYDYTDADFLNVIRE